ncbi:28S ribosomal protein S7, mitochondrial [Osmia bicornis bicornis]|uniref:28S ribosomal protein S7, mitochondrial n=1 Tax=Osmia bicornis bicornis TaxID=1437191 RepID=UPI001EAF7078|nr:28S ribosomal protein S7, mitochondrial [Osmia bicornis bicornis]
MILKRTCNLLILRQNQISIQFYSLFPTSYVPPVYKKDQQKEIFETPEGKQLSHTPIKPALTSDTCSEFHDEIIRKFINYIMRKGQRAVARRVLETAFENIKIIQLKKYYDAAPEEKDNIVLDPKTILYRAIENCTPILDLHNISRGGITYKVPVPISERKGQFKSMNWLIETAKDKPNQTHLVDALAKELISAANNEGRTVKKKQDLHKQCEENRAYAHYRWLE